MGRLPLRKGGPLGRRLLAGLDEKVAVLLIRAIRGWGVRSLVEEDADV